MSACSRRGFLKGSHAGGRDPGGMVSSRAAGCSNLERRDVHLSTRSSRPGRGTTETFACWNSPPRSTAKVGQAPGSTGSTTAARRPDRALRRARSLPPAPLPRTSELARSCRLGSGVQPISSPRHLNRVDRTSSQLPSGGSVSR
jgi:hypothetical protein